MKKYFGLFLIPLLFSCTINQNRTKKDMEDWIFSFKAQTCTSCLNNMEVIIPKDNSNWLRFEILGIEYQKKADSIGKVFTDTINIKAKYFNNTDIAGGKAITNGCLLLFSSKKLDSIAKKLYKKKVKEDKKLWGKE